MHVCSRSPGLQSILNRLTTSSANPTVESHRWPTPLSTACNASARQSGPQPRFIAGSSVRCFCTLCSIHHSEVRSVWRAPCISPLESTGFKGRATSGHVDACLSARGGVSTQSVTTIVAGRHTRGAGNINLSTSASIQSFSHRVHCLLDFELWPPHVMHFASIL